MWNKKWRSERDWNKYSSGFILGKTKNNHGILNLALFAGTFDECLPAILTLIQHSLMEICWEYEALTFSSSLANKTPFKQSVGNKGDSHCNCNQNWNQNPLQDQDHQQEVKEGRQLTSSWALEPVTGCCTFRWAPSPPPPASSAYPALSKKQTRAKKVATWTSASWHGCLALDKNLSAQRTHPCARDQPRRLPQLVWDPTSCAFTWHVMVARKKNTTERNKCAKPEGLWKIRKHINDACCSGLPHAS